MSPHKGVFDRTRATPRRKPAAKKKTAAANKAPAAKATEHAPVLRICKECGMDTLTDRCRACGSPKLREAK